MSHRSARGSASASGSVDLNQHFSPSHRLPCVSLGRRIDAMSTDKLTVPGGALSGLVASAAEYMVDAGQRSALFLDVLRQRGDQYREHVAQTAPHVLSYAAELIIDGRKLDEPVNYALVRIIPPKDVEIDLDRRP